jgi:hypothetical protein
MASKHGFVSRLCRLALGTLFIALPVTVARADTTPTTYWEAQTKADHYQKRAEQLRASGGAAYKSGLVRQAEAQTTKYAVLGDQLGAPPDEPPMSAEAAAEAKHYATLVSHYHAMGGPAYSGAAVQAAEEEQLKYEGPAAGKVTVRDSDGGKVTERDNYACQSNKPIAMIDCNETEEAE